MYIVYVSSIPPSAMSVIIWQATPQSVMINCVQVKPPPFIQSSHPGWLSCVLSYSHIDGDAEHTNIIFTNGIVRRSRLHVFDLQVGVASGIVF